MASGNSIVHPSRVPLLAQVMLWEREQKGGKSQKTGKSTVKHCLLDMTQHRTHEHTAAVVADTKPEQDQIR